MEHTKGEWITKDFMIYSITDEKGRTIAYINHTGFSDEEAGANARLIVACPLMLAALQGDEENCVPNAQTILAQALLGNYMAVKEMLRELCSIHATAIIKATKQA